MKEATPCRCGADDCRQCHPESFAGGHYITCDPDEFHLTDDGTLDTVICGPNGFETRYDMEFAADWRDESGALDIDRFIKEVVLGLDHYVNYMADLD